MSESDISDPVKAPEGLDPRKPPLTELLRVCLDNRPDGAEPKPAAGEESATREGRETSEKAKTRTGAASTVPTEETPAADKRKASPTPATARPLAARW